LTGVFIEGVSLAKVITANAIDGEIQSIVSFIQTAEMKEKQTGPTNG
jgi:hypothetical protein